MPCALEASLILRSSGGLRFLSAILGVLSKVIRLLHRAPPNRGPIRWESVPVHGQRKDKTGFFRGVQNCGQSPSLWFLGLTNHCREDGETSHAGVANDPTFVPEQNVRGSR
jgi:hypothetical protein